MSGQEVKINVKEKSTASPAKDVKKKAPAGTSEREKATEKKGAERVPEKQTHSDKAKDSNAGKAQEKSKKVEAKDRKPDPPKQNGNQSQQNNGKDGSRPSHSKPAQNGVLEVTVATSNGAGEALNGASAPDLEDDDVMVIVDENDELFPELRYDEASDSEGLERDTPDLNPSRSRTRRSQVKAARTPETPRPASDKQGEKEKEKTANGEEKDSQQDASGNDKGTKAAPKPKEAAVSTRKLRSTDRSTPEPSAEAAANQGDKPAEKETDKVDDSDTSLKWRRETNYSKTRVKVSPYRRGEPVHDQSTLANYTGNNTTMEMDITESSLGERSAPPTPADPALDNSYVVGLRAIRGRRSYKQLQPMDLKKLARTPREGAPSSPSLSVISSRKRRAVLVGEGEKEGRRGDAEVEGDVQAKRMRPSLLQRVMTPLLHTLPSRRHAPIVGVNSDLPLSTPVAPREFDPETIAPAADAVKGLQQVHVPVPVPATGRDGQKHGRCVVM